MTKELSKKMNLTFTIPHWWNYLTVLRRAMAFVAIFVMILCIAPGQSYGNIKVKNTNYNLHVSQENPNTSETRKHLNGGELEEQEGTEAGNHACGTPACVAAAKHIKRNMMKSGNPCDDFYDYVCGSFIQNTVIPDDKDIVSSFTIINDHVKEQLRKSIEKPITSDDNKATKHVKNLYKSCMDILQIEKAGINPLLKTLKDLGGWPVLENDDWDESKFHWIESIHKAHDMGHSSAYFFYFGIITDTKDTTKRVIAVDQASLGLSREYLVEGKNDTILNAYRTFMIDIAVLLGASPEVAQRDLEASLEFEKRLADISLPKNKRRNATLLHNPMSVAEMSEKFHGIPWKQYFNRFLAPNVSIDDDETIDVIVPSYLSKFVELMKATSLRIQANYFMWRIVMDSVSFLNEGMRLKEFEFITKIDGSVKREERWRECTNIVSMSLPLSVGSLYVKTYFNKDAKKNAVEMVADIKNQFTEILKKVDWMDEDTRRSALDKAASMSSHIAYPEELLDNEKMDQYYSSLELNGGNYLKSMLDLSIFSAHDIIGQLKKPVNKSEWIRHGRSAVVNAYYAPTENSIQFPAAILQGPFFDNDRPKYMNYGAIGFVIGHEITHGFDDQGRQFDKNGSIIDWWATLTEEKYLDKSHCIIDQYDNYTVPEVGLQLSGVNTQGENIADNGGIKTAYLAYKKWVLKNGEEPRLPGLNFTSQQLFWISAANTWCTKIRPESLKFHITTDYHSPARYRVNGPLSNMIDFATDFKCTEGTKMNPMKKCAVW